MKKKIFKEKCLTVNNIINGSEKDFLVKELNSDTALIDYAISRLDEESQRILYFDFVYRSKKYWWREYYSKSTYYRLKNVALDKLLENLNTDNIWGVLNESD